MNGDAEYGLKRITRRLHEDEEENEFIPPPKHWARFPPTIRHSEPRKVRISEEMNFFNEVKQVRLLRYFCQVCSGSWKPCTVSRIPQVHWPFQVQFRYTDLNVNQPRHNHKARADKTDKRLVGESEIVISILPRIYFLF
jgi:hypothetical protein